MKYNDLLQKLRRIPKPVLREQMLCILVSLALSLLSFLTGITGGNLKNGYQLARDRIGGSEEQYQISVMKEDGVSLPVKVSVSPIRYTKEEADALFNEIISEIEPMITDDSQTLAALDHDLTLPRELPDKGIRLDWDFYLDNPEESRKYHHLLDTDGTLHNEDLPDGTVVSGYLSLILSTYIVPDSGTPSRSPAAESEPGTSFSGDDAGNTVLDVSPSGDDAGNTVLDVSPSGDDAGNTALDVSPSHDDAEMPVLDETPSSAEAETPLSEEEETSAEPVDYFHKRYRSEPYRIYVNIMPRQYTGAEAWQKAFDHALAEADRSTLSKERMELPKEIAGQPISYSEKSSATFLLFPVLGILAAILLYFRQGANQKDIRKKRENQLLLDYSELVSKLMVYLGAGLTLRNSFLLIAEHADNLVKRGIQENRALYDELHIMANQFAKNMPESEIYTDFGRRIHLKPYTKLVSLIEQNRKNGTSNLRALLEVEMNDAFTERKNTARRLGEEAGTKLLLPLFLLLAIVMCIVIVPALTSFHG